MTRRLAVKRGKTSGKWKRRSGARGHVVFEAVAVQVDDTGKDQKARQVDLGQWPAREATLSQPDGPQLQFAIAQDLRASQAQWGQVLLGHFGITTLFSNR